MGFNEAQQRVVNKKEGQMAAIACPGSGKTTIMIERAHKLVLDGIRPNSILLLTFTKDAAENMRKRYIKKYGDDSVQFATIHKFCGQVLRLAIGFNPKEHLIKAADVTRFLKAEIADNKDIKDRDSFVRALLMDISNVKNNRLNRGGFQPTCWKDEDLFWKLFDAYENMKSKDGKYDFDDMLVLAYEALENNPNLLAAYQRQYRYIQVDEHQDTNFLQRDIIYLLAGENPNLLVVGDDDQSIYRFRGARPEVILNFQKDFPDAEVVYMTTNYRSDKSIIRYADTLIRHNTVRYPKEFLASSNDEGHVETFLAGEQDEEIKKIVEDIENRMKTGETLEEMAILYRTNTQALPFVDEFIKKNIPFHSNKDSGFNKYDHWLFREFLSYFHLATDSKPSYMDRKSLFAGFYLYGNDWLQVPFKRNDLKRHALTKQFDADWKRMKAMENIDTLFNMLELFQTETPSSALHFLEFEGGYRKKILQYAEKRHQEPDDLLRIWESYKKDATECGDTWEALFDHIDKYNAILEHAAKKKEGIALSTMHSAKGLEWDTVYIEGCVTGVCPSSMAETDEDIEEERRLFYVGMTRARHNLFMGAYTKGQRRVDISPFIREMNGIKSQSKIAKKQATSPRKGLMKGDHVFHKKFGEAEIVEVTDSNYVIKITKSADLNISDNTVLRLNKSHTDRNNLLKKH